MAGPRNTTAFDDATLVVSALQFGIAQLAYCVSTVNQALAVEALQQTLAHCEKAMAERGASQRDRLCVQAAFEAAERSVIERPTR